MERFHLSLWPIFLLWVFTSCSEDVKSDAYGNFEATTVTVSAKGKGALHAFEVEEGQRIEINAVVGYIDTIQLHLEKLQMQAQLRALYDKTQDAGPEIAILKERRKNLIRERNRTIALVKEKAATQKQLDDYNGEIDVIDRQIASTERQTNITNRGILAEDDPLQAQVKVLEQKIADHYISNPISGTVLTKLAEPGEYVSSGTPLYRIANLDYLTLRAYTSATILQQVSLNDEVTVLIDDGKEAYRSFSGKITWIASEAEFTPKSIETKEERVNLIYALDIRVKNDGSLRIGMPGEVLFQSPTS